MGVGQPLQLRVAQTRPARTSTALAVLPVWKASAERLQQPVLGTAWRLEKEQVLEPRGLESEEAKWLRGLCGWTGRPQVRGIVRAERSEIQ